MRLSSKNIYNLNFILYLLIATIPIAIILGNLLINIYIFLISSFYLILNLKKNIFKNKNFLLLLLFFGSLIINLIFSDNFNQSLPRVLKFFFIIFFIMSFEYYIKTKDLNSASIYKVWFVILVVFSIDILIEYFFGQNILGMKSYMPGRLASFFGNELVAGYFFLGFALLFYSYLIDNFKINIIYLVLIFFFMIFISLIIGERSNFIKCFIGLSLITLVTFRISFYKKFFLILSTLFLIFTFINFNENYKLRFYDQVKKIYSQNGITEYLKDSQYGALYNTAYQIFEKNKLFGVGIKNYRDESPKSEYYNNEYKYTFQRSSTHPHQIHYEFLSETGIFGYLIFLLFIFLSIFVSLKNYLVYKSNYQLAGIIFIMISLIPYLPSGSFFSTFNSVIFWINYAIMMSYNKNSVKF